MSEQVSEFDVVVVGSGAGGLVGALSAADRGLRVVVLEKAEYFGGTTALSGAGLWAPANLHVLAAGQPDNLDAARTYMRHTVGDRTPAAMQEAFLAAAAPTIAYLEDRGVRFSFMTGYPDYHPDLPGGLLTGRAITPKMFTHDRLASVPRPVLPKMAMGDGGPPIPDTGPTGPMWGGQSLIAQLLIACEAAGVALWGSAPFLDLQTRDGHVTGVRARREGRDVVIDAPAGVLLAAGGFERNAPMRADLQAPVVAHAQWTLGAEGNTGDGIRAGIELGAATDLLEDCWWAPGFLRPDGAPSFLLWERAAPGGIIVDQAGRRWVNEGTPYNTFGHLMLAAQARDGRAIPSWFVADQHFFDTYGFGGLRPGADTTPWVEAGALIRCATVAELAERLDAPDLAATVQRYNHFVDLGVDGEFGRGAGDSYERQVLAVFQRYPGIPGPHRWPNPSLAPVAQGPFYAGQVVLSDLGTKGGLVCDEQARVLRPDGTAIEGLYACGNTMASMMGHAYPGPGACITPAMAFGHLAAGAMAASVEGATS
ncbi:MAG: FAD-dependent oxidoreductase [Actinomycetota bacterium]|nr:FAD-dependent oxidoreductase [Actinomycetota bacterium]